MSFDWKAAVPWIFLPFVGSIPGNLMANPKNKTWYKGLKKPSWCPPDWVIGPVWTTLYTSIGVASYLVYRDGGGFSGDAKYPLMLYGAKLALNWSWAPIFFQAHKLKLAFYDCLMLWGFIAATGISFYNINPLAGYLFLPYQTWVSLATAITYYIWQNNKEKSE